MQSLVEREQLQPKARGLSERSADPGSFAIFTAVEGTLLDLDTFEAAAAVPLLGHLRLVRVPVVPVTVMTLEEIAPIAEDLGMTDPMIIEAGGAVARWSGESWNVEQVGPSADTLIDAICEIEEMSGADLTVYSVLPEHVSARLSGRKGAMLHASLHRRFSEPFLIERGEVARVARAAALLGLTLVRGQRFYYLSRTATDGIAFDHLRDELRCETTIGVGGSQIDASFLSRCDIPIIVPRPDGSVDNDLLAKVPTAILAPAPGDRGWAVAVQQVLSAFVSVKTFGATA